MNIKMYSYKKHAFFPFKVNWVKIFIFLIFWDEILYIHGNKVQQLHCVPLFWDGLPSISEKCIVLIKQELNIITESDLEITVKK